MEFYQQNTEAIEEALKKITMQQEIWKLPGAAAAQQHHVKDSAGSAAGAQHQFQHVKIERNPAAAQERGGDNAAARRQRCLLRTLWARINLPNVILTYYETITHYDGFARVKTKMFIDRHLPLAQAADAGGVGALRYEPLGISQFPDDFSHTEIVSTEKIQLKPTPLEALSDCCWEVSALANHLKTGGYSLGTLRALVDGVAWDPLRHVHAKERDLRHFSLYYACVLIVNHCEEHVDDFMHHVYKLAFVDFFYHALASGAAVDDTTLLRNNIWRLHYPIDVRGFIGDDLPNYFHMLWQIPLAGQLDVPEYPLMNVLMKCMPFACQRRQLLDSVEDYCAVDAGNGPFCRNEAFWRVFSKIIWCSLAGAYPDDTVRPGMQKLLRIKQLCDNRALLLDAFTRGRAKQIAEAIPEATRRLKELKTIKKERESNCLVIFTAFRQWVLHMVRYNPHYAEAASTVIDWEHLRQETNRMGDLIRNTNLFVDDVFCEARIQLKRANKNEKRIVYRYHKQSCVGTILTESNRVLEKVIYSNTIEFQKEIELLLRMEQEYLRGEAGPATILEMVKENRVLLPYFTTTEKVEPRDYFQNVSARDILGSQISSVLELWQTLLASLERPIQIYVKENILNYLVKVPVHQRISPMSLCVMMDPRYGGVHEETIHVLLDMIELYGQSALPKAVQQCFGKMAIEDVRAVAWYFGVCNALEQIAFIPLDFHTVQRIDYAMSHVRYPLFPGQRLDDSVYSVLYSICCRQVKTMVGKNCFGHREVVYDLQNRMILCDKETKTNPTEMLGTGLPSEKLRQKAEKSRNRDMRLGFHEIPCLNQPLLTIPLRQHAILVGPKLKKKKRYIRCPRCACLHVFDAARYRDGNYCCEECAQGDLRYQESGSYAMVYQCAYCRVGGATGHMSGQTSRPRVRPEDVLLVMDVPVYGEPAATLFPIYEPRQTFQLLRFCHTCYKIAKQDSHRIPKVFLYRRIKNRIAEQLKLYNK
jgi:hypothetical protein